MGMPRTRRRRWHPDPGLRRAAHRRRPAHRLASRARHTHQRRRHATNASQLAVQPPKSIARSKTHRSKATSPTRHAIMVSSSPTSSHPQRTRQDERPPRASVLPTSPRSLAFSASKSSTLCQNIPAAARRTSQSAHFRNRHSSEPPHVPYTHAFLGLPLAGRHVSAPATIVDNRPTHITTFAADAGPLAPSTCTAPHDTLPLPLQDFLAASA